MPEHTFRRGERLKSRKEIGLLFSGKSRSFAQYPLRLVWRYMDERKSDFPLQFAMSVPKRRFKRAVQRNRLRRRIREAFRLHKSELLGDLPATSQRQLAWMVLYIGKEEASYQEIDVAMQKMMRRFMDQLKEGRSQAK